MNNKNDYELATEMTIALINAKAAIISQIESTQPKRDTMYLALSDEAIANSFKMFFKALSAPTE